MYRSSRLVVNIAIYFEVVTLLSLSLSFKNPKCVSKKSSHVSSCRKLLFLEDNQE
jgi:hypothetical protein